MQLAQTALEPGDPISFAPYYSILPMTDPYGAQTAPHAVVTMNTIGDMNVPLNSGIGELDRISDVLSWSCRAQSRCDVSEPFGSWWAVGAELFVRSLIDARLRSSGPPSTRDMRRRLSF